MRPIEMHAYLEGISLVFCEIVDRFVPTCQEPALALKKTEFSHR